MICSDCGKRDDACECDVAHYIKTGEKSKKGNMTQGINRRLTEAAVEIAKEGHAGWGNLILEAIAELAKKDKEIAELKICRDHWKISYEQLRGEPDEPKNPRS